MNDNAILLGLKDNNSNAIEQFWRTYYDRIHPICAFILGKGPDARDITVDILVDFIERHCRTLTSSKAIYSFLRQAAIRRSIRYRDRRGRYCDVALDNHISDEMSPEERADLNMMIPFLNQCLSELTPKAQASLRLKYSQKISNERIGEMLGGSKSYIGRVLKNGRDTLGKCIEKKMKQELTERSSRTSWQPAQNALVTGQMVEAMLAARPTAEVAVCEENERFFEAINRFDDATEIAFAHRHVQQCEACRETVLALAGQSGVERDVVDREARVISLRPKMKPQIAKGLAAAAMVVLGLALWFTLSPANPVTSPPADQLSPKGASADRFFVAAKRQGTSFTIHPLDRILSGDQLGFFYSVQESGYLAIFSRDQAKAVVPLFPTTGDESAPVSLGNKVPIKDGAVVGDGAQCEWLIAVFSNEPLPLEQLARAIADGERVGKETHCGLNVSIQSARTVRVVPVTR